eukprot:920570-Ditylum_brightwellii.AAC.1
MAPAVKGITHTSGELITRVALVSPFFLSVLSSCCAFSSCLTSVRFACIKFINTAQSKSAALARCSSASV